MRANSEKNPELNFDRIEKGKIILNGMGRFPKEVVITGRSSILRYRLIKTKNGKYQLNK